MTASLADLCNGPLTFMGVPHSWDLSKARAAILGIPFDCGIHPFRVGARSGPQSIREQSRLMRPFNPELSDYSPMKRLGLVDCGDLKLTPGRILPAFEVIEAGLGAILSAGAAPITMGGDGSISHPQMRAVALHHPDLVAIHLDSHTDTTPPVPGNEHNAGTQFHYAATERLVDTAASYHIGMRGTTYIQGGFPRTHDLGYRNVITQNQLLKRGFEDMHAEIEAELEDRPVYLCIDMDVFDPSCAPGVCAPSWGGLSAREGLDFVRGLAGLNIVAIDVNTVSPPHDVNGMAASLAAAVLYETLVLLCKRFGLDEFGPD